MNSQKLKSGAAARLTCVQAAADLARIYNRSVRHSGLELQATAQCIVLEVEQLAVRSQCYLPDIPVLPHRSSRRGGYVLVGLASFSSQSGSLRFGCLERRKMEKKWNVRHNVDHQGQ